MLIYLLRRPIVLSNPYAVCTSDRLVTKHYFVGDQRIASNIKDVTDRQKKNKNKTINISVQKRDNVDWNYVVGSDGKKTSKGL